MGGTGFGPQANALMRKSMTYQKRNVATNCCLLSAPIFFCILLFIMQKAINAVFNNDDKYKCGCMCTQCCYTNSSNPAAGEYCYVATDGPCPDETGYTCKERDTSTCGIRYSSAGQATFCSVPIPSSWPPFQQVPDIENRAQSPSLPIMMTGSDLGLAADLGAHMYTQLKLQDPDYVERMLALAANNNSDSYNGYALSLLGFQMGTNASQQINLYVEKAFREEDALYVLLPSPTCDQYNISTQEPTNFLDFLMQYVNGSTGGQLSQLMSLLDSNLIQQLNSSSGNSSGGGGGAISMQSLAATCADVPIKIMDNVQDINDALYCGYYKARCNGTAVIAEYSTAYDWRATTTADLDVDMYYNKTSDSDNNNGGQQYTYRLPQLLSLAAKAWWRKFSGNPDPVPPIEALGVMSMPTAANELKLDFSSLLGPLFYTWVVQMLLPTFLQQLVYEKEKRLRMMMKMHGLGDAAYWLVTYLWYLAIYIVYIAIFIIFGAAIGLNIFRKTNIGIQIITYFLFGNVMIAFAFVLSSLFSSSRTAVVFSFLYVFATGLIGELLLKVFMNQDAKWVIALELVPAWGLYRCLYEFSEYTFLAVYRNERRGLMFSNLGDSGNGIPVVWIIFVVEWPLMMLLAWYLEQVVSSGTGTRRHPLFFLPSCCRKANAKHHEHAFARSSVEEAEGLQMATLEEGRGASSRAAGASGEAADVAAERERVEAMGDDEAGQHPIVMGDLRKAFPPVGGAKAKIAVRSITMAVERGECFGLLGPNGAGKSTTINMLTGFLEPSHGTALVEGIDIRTDMQQVYKLMGVCPQHDLLWEQLSAREHLLFYGRLKGLTGSEMADAVESALRSVNLWLVADKRVGQFSGGMKRRLSVAISFIGDPKVVYLDEPSTGLDPASRRALWEVVKGGKGGRAIVLTTHSMEEAEALCDRLGIFVDGRLVCLGNPKEITSRYAGYLVFTLTVPPQQEPEAQEVVRAMSPGARLTYCLGGTLKYELPQQDVTLSRVFEHMAWVKSQGKVDVLDWAVANATLEEVFIKLAKAVGAETSEGH